MKLKSKIFFALLGIIVVIQFFRIDKTNPTVDIQNDIIAYEQVPGDIADILKASCYDCHSNVSVYPWYTNVAPVSWWIKKHINEARDELNFSTWGTFTEKRKDHKLEEIGEMIEEGEMPLGSYLLMHGEAKLDEEQAEKLINWAGSPRISQ